MFTYTWSSEEFDVHLVCDSLVGGLCAGGLRLSSTTTRDDVAQLARLMSLKFAIGKIPLGGAKSAVVPKTDTSRAHAIKTAAHALEPFLRTRYLVGEDSGTSASDIIDVYRALDLDPIELAAVKAKERGAALTFPDGFDPEQLMNDEFAGILSGSSVAHSLEVAAAMVDEHHSGKRVAVQGFGSVGHATAVALANRGARIVTIADVAGALHHPDGFDLEFLNRARLDDGRIDRSDLPKDCTTLPGEQWLGQPADVLIPAARASVITETNLEAIHPDVRFVVEGANGPLSTEAEHRLEDGGVIVVPDIVANAGSAMAFGLLITGECALADIGTEYLARIAGAVEQCATRATSSLPYARDRALAIAENYLAASTEADPTAHAKELA